MKYDETIDRTQGSTHLPEFPCVAMQKPAEYQRVLTLNDVPNIRSVRLLSSRVSRMACFLTRRTYMRNRYSAKAHSQVEKDYRRTRNDLYRMQLDNVAGYREGNRDNMVRVYHSYLENTPGSKKALREVCDQITANTASNTLNESAD
jgi:hypothetical protein